MATKHRRARSRRQPPPRPRFDQSAASDSMRAAVLEEFLLECIEGIDTDEAERLLGDTSLPTTPEEAFGGFIAEAEAVLPSLRSPLDAEMWGSQLLGMFGLMGLDPPEVDEIVAEFVVPMAGAAATEAALALLVVLSSLGGLKSAPAAETARRKSIAAGLPEPAWAASLGRPTVGRCWVCGDVFGEQESVFTTFRYGRSEHVLCALVDHGLGGGVNPIHSVSRSREPSQLDEPAHAGRRRRCPSPPGVRRP